MNNYISASECVYLSRYRFRHDTATFADRSLLLVEFHHDVCYQLTIAFNLLFGPMLNWSYRHQHRLQRWRRICIFIAFYPLDDLLHRHRNNHRGHHFVLFGRAHKKTVVVFLVHTSARLLLYLCIFVCLFLRVFRFRRRRRRRRLLTRLAICGALFVTHGYPYTHPEARPRTHTHPPHSPIAHYIHAIYSHCVVT